jgi:transposase/predicted flap endonuclease-1-like 5' DNA nuclease
MKVVAWCRMKISPDLFQAHLKCPTKCWLRATGEASTGNTYAEWVKSQDETYRTSQTAKLVAEALNGEVAPSPPVEDLKSAKWQCAVEIRATIALRGSRGNEAQISSSGADQNLPPSAATVVESRLHAVERIPSEGRGKAAQFIPIRFIYRNKLTKDDKLLLAFDAFVLSESIGREISTGKIIHGEVRSCARESAAISQAPTTEVPSEPTSAAFSRTQPRVTKVKTSTLAAEVRKRLDKIATLLTNEKPPDLVLNRHCPECEFRDRCRQKAIEADDLSLLAGMSAKERQKLRSKGIFTVTQLSYMFRPRRRPKRLRDKCEKYHHALKALAIREKNIHIVGSPELKIEGTPVYLDVEGLPDRDFYYLIGLRIGHGDSAVQHSLWADTVADEAKIWRKFLAILETVEKPVLIHYGSYETTFLKRMSERHVGSETSISAPQGNASAINLLSFLFGRIYFPTHSNRLKDVGAILGARWNLPSVTGLHAVSWRCDWEQSREAEIKGRLLTYNQDDCAALDILTTELLNLVTNAKSRSDVDFADAPKNCGSDRVADIHRTFSAVLGWASSDYSKSRIALASAGFSKRAPTSKKKASYPANPKLPRVRGRVIRARRKMKCDLHPDHPTMLVPTETIEHALLDVAFTVNGCRKTVLRYVGKKARCPYCTNKLVPPAFKQAENMVYGPGFTTWIVYLRVALRLPYRLAAQATLDLLGAELSNQGLMNFVNRCAERHLKTEQRLLETILQSPAIHVDETKLSIVGHQQYVWVLSDGRHVIFRLTESRETDFLEPLLAGYQGTLVSDFYGGYDALPCRQQKCLVHLIRDLNDDLWKKSFNVELEAFVASVRDLLLPIFADVLRCSPFFRPLEAVFNLWFSRSVSTPF